jgi:hypothetical protein
MPLAADDDAAVKEYTVASLNISFSVKQPEPDPSPTYDVGYFVQQVVEGGSS